MNSLKTSAGTVGELVNVMQSFDLCRSTHTEERVKPKFPDCWVGFFLSSSADMCPIVRITSWTLRHIHGYYCSVAMPSAYLTLPAHCLPVAYRNGSLGYPILVCFLLLQLFIPSSEDGRRDSQQCCQETFPTKLALW